MSTIWSGVGTFAIYLAAILSIAGFVLQLLALFNGLPANFLKGARKATLEKIARLNQTFSNFYDTVNFVDEGTKLGPLFVRISQFIFMFIFYSILVIVVKLLQGEVIGLITLLLSATLSFFLLFYYDLVDDFSQYLFTEYQDYTFTILKPQIQKFSVNLSQNLFLISLVWLYLFLDIILIIGPSQFINYAVSTPIVPLSFMIISMLLSLLLGHEFNGERDELITWSFEKFRIEEDLKLPLVIERKALNGDKEVISGNLYGIGREIALFQEDGLVQEIPWSNIGNTKVGSNAVLRLVKVAALQDFFDKLIGKPLTIYNKAKITRVTLRSYPNPIRRAIRKFGENAIRYFDERTGAEVMQFFLHSWEITLENEKRILCLDLSTEFGAPPLIRFKVNPKKDFVIRTDEGTSYKILSYDLKDKVITYKEIP